MPSTVTHAYFALDIYDKLDNESKKRLNYDTEYLKIFSQGPDPFHFYNLALPIKGKNVRKNYVRKLHDTNTKKFFITLISEIKNQNLKNDSQIISFLYGFIAHYVLDSTIHPYIIYKTGIYEKNNVNTKKYRSLHNDMELYLDGYLIFQRERTQIKNFKMYNFCFNINSLNLKTKNLLDKVIKEVYDLDDFSKLYFKSIKQMKAINRLFRYDRTGIKKKVYIALDKILPKKQLKKEQLSYYINYKKKLHYLNIEKNEWNHPFDKYETYNYSFIELYHIALNKAVNIINSVNEVLYNKKDIKSLDTVFKNLSYKTGKDCNDSRKLKYFEY